MNFKISYLFLIFLFLKEINNSDFTENYFYFQLVDDNMKTGASISPTIGEDGYLYLVTGSNIEFEDNLFRRYIITYDINSASFISKYTYSTAFGFNEGDAYAFLDKSQYLFISTYSSTLDSGSYGIRDVRDEEGIIWEDSSIKGYRRFFKKAGNYFYFAHLDSDRNHLLIKKMEIAYYKDNIPRFEISKTNSQINVDTDSIISCDLTRDNNYIIFAYDPERFNVSISAFNKDLELLITKNLTSPLEYSSVNYIKIINFKENSNFIVMYSNYQYRSRLSYVSYTNNEFVDKLSSITKNSQTFIEIENSQDSSLYYLNEVIAVDDKVIKMFGSKPSNKIIITIIQFYENDSSMSIKIYNLVNNNGFISFYNPKIAMLKQSFIFCASAKIDNIRRPGYFIINYPNSTDINLYTSNI